MKVFEKMETMDDLELFLWDRAEAYKRKGGNLARALQVLGDHFPVDPDISPAGAACLALEELRNMGTARELLMSLQQPEYQTSTDFRGFLEEHAPTEL